MNPDDHFLSFFDDPTEGRTVDAVCSCGQIIASHKASEAIPSLESAYGAYAKHLQGGHHSIKVYSLSDDHDGEESTSFIVECESCDSVIFYWRQGEDEFRCAVPIHEAAVEVHMHILRKEVR